MLPMFLKMHIRERGKKGVRLWIPVFLVWILLFALMLVLLPLVLLASLLTIWKGPGLALLLFYPMVWAVLWSLSSLYVDVENSSHKILFTFI
jgi:hypothetical protein